MHQSVSTHILQISLWSGLHTVPVALSRYLKSNQKDAKMAIQPKVDDLEKAGKGHIEECGVSWGP